MQIRSEAVILLWLTATVSPGQVTLPIEVMGSPPHVEAVTVHLGPEEAGRADHLWGQVHNVSYEGKARVRVNGGAWIPLWNDSEAVVVAEPDRAYGGFGGGFSTVAFRIPVPHVAFRTGANSIEFEYGYKHPGHATAGYRVIRMNILDEKGRSLVPASGFLEEDPQTWGPPLETAADIAAGEAIWRSADLGMAASCKDCHTDDGRDLKYFNFSNKVIIEQCKKSGFSEHQGKRVASYIRSLPLEAPPLARPWNPPYQPGPGTDQRPVFEWAAGAGLEAVLPSDAAMLPHLFGSATAAEIAAVIDLDTDLNLREIPIAVQFPDWLHWLPRSHPMDVWGETYWETEKGENPAVRNWRNPHQSYQYISGQFRDANLANRSDLVTVMDNQFQRNILWWIGDARSGHPWTDLEGKNIDRAKARGYTAEEAKLNLSRWRAVKLWELFHTYDAEDKAGNHIPTAEKFQWPAGYFSVFQLAAHFIGDNRGTSCFAWESEATGTYFSSIWYQLQMVLNSGMRMGRDVSPVDWAYNFYHINILGERTGVHEPLRLVQNLIKCYQQRSRPGEPISKEVWSMREVSPWRIYSDFKGDATTMSMLDGYGHGKDLRIQITEALLRQFLRRSTSYAPSEWPRASERLLSPYNWYRLEPESYIPVEEPDAVTGYNLFGETGASDAIEGDALFRLIPLFHAMGMDSSLVGQLANWCASVWPAADWQMRASDSDGDGLHDGWEGLRYRSLQWGADDDPDKSGLNNLQSYAMGLLHPLEPGINIQPATGSGDAIGVHYRRPIYRKGFATDLLTSGNLRDWTPSVSAPDFIGASVQGEDALFQTIVEWHRFDGNPQRFFRLMVQEDKEQDHP